MANFLGFVVFMATVVIGSGQVRVGEAPWRIHTLFSTECQDYFDWQTVGLMHSYRKARQPGPITRLLSCTEEQKKVYKGMELAPTMEVPSMSRHPSTGDWYPAINKPAGVVYWLENSEDAQNVDWVVILDADMIIRGPIVPWELGVERGRPVAAHYGYLIGCDNILAKLHTMHPEMCDKVGGLLAFHIDDLRALAPLWLSKTEEVRADRAHWATNITGDVYGKGWISEMYGYSFGAAEVGLHHKITDDLMIYPGDVPRKGVEPILFHYGLPFRVGNWSFEKLDYHNDALVYECGRLFPQPPFPKEVRLMESDHDKWRGLMLSIECINTLNEGFLLHHTARGCPRPRWRRYLSFLTSRAFAELTKPKQVKHITFLDDEDAFVDDEIDAQPLVDSYRTPTAKEVDGSSETKPRPKIHTIFSTECNSYFDWQTVGFVHSFRLSGQPGDITRLLSCTDEDWKRYTGRDLAPTHYVPSMSTHPLTGDVYPAINKPAAVLHWINHAQIDAEFVVILDADMLMRGPITPWDFNASRGHPVSAPYNYLVGCDTELAKLHTRNPKACDKVGGVIIMHIEDLRKFAMLWLHKTEEVRADKEHYATKYSGDVYEHGWISEMYGYSFGAAELNLRHVINPNIMFYPGGVPNRGVDYRVLHYGEHYKIGDNYTFDKKSWRNVDLVNKCWAKFPDPPELSTLDTSDEDARARDLVCIECVRRLNDALYYHHIARNCSDTMLDDEVRGSKKSETKSDETLSSFRVMLIGVWAASVAGFLAWMFIVFFGCRRRKGKHQRSKKRTSNPERFVSDGADVQKDLKGHIVTL